MPNSLITRTPKFSFALILFAYIFGVSPTPHHVYDETSSRFCEEENIRIQLVYVLDCTGGFANAVAQISKVAEPLSKKILLSKFAKFEQAVVCFSDYLESAIPEPNKPRGRSPTIVYSEDCYKRKSTMSTNAKDVSKIIAKAGFTLYGGKNDVESSTTALIFAAADKGIGWNKGNFDSVKNLKVNKFIVLATDEASTTKLSNPGSRKPAKGDGEDHCTKTLPPTPEIVAKIVTDYNISVVGIYQKRGWNAAGYYKDYFSKLNITYSQLEIDLADKNVNDKIVDTIFVAINLPVEAECEESDPEAYNTLGL